MMEQLISHPIDGVTEDPAVADNLVIHAGGAGGAL